MSDHPINFTAPMIRALLDGRKIMDRRLALVFRREPMDHWRPSPWQHVKPGDRLWVRHAPNLFDIYYKPILFGSGKYAVGTDGHVYDLSGPAPTRRQVRVNHNGYEEINLRHAGEQRPFRVNRLVAEAFYGIPADDEVCRHMDGNRRNNRPENLDWGTAADNSLDAVAAGSFAGEKASKARLSRQEVQEIRSSSEEQAALAMRYGVTQPTISKIRSGKRWSDQRIEAPPRNRQAFSLWASPIHMPRWASTITLVVTATKIERVQEISEDDAVAEGCFRTGWTPKTDKLASEMFRGVWEELHGSDSWNANPEVVCLSFTVHKTNIDALEDAA